MHNSKIYKIIPTIEYVEGDVYIGSTTAYYLCGRMNNHRCDYRKWLDGKYHYLTVFSIFDKYGLENCKIELIEDCSHITTKHELLTRERYYIEQIKCVNKERPIISDEERSKYKAEWHQDNKNRPDYIELRKKNSEKYNEKARENKINCECGVSYCIRKKNRHLQTASHILKIRLKTDEEFRRNTEETKKKENELRIERQKQYKAEWHRQKIKSQVLNIV